VSRFPTFEREGGTVLVCDSGNGLRRSAVRLLTAAQRNVAIGLLRLAGHNNVAVALLGIKSEN
jgi:hypothetical protein